MSRWKLLCECSLFDATAIPLVMKPIVLDILSEHPTEQRDQPLLVLDDPALSLAENFLPTYRTGGQEPLEYLVAWMHKQGMTARYYVRATGDAGLEAQIACGAGYWRREVDSDEELPWPVPDPSWPNGFRHYIEAHLVKPPNAFDAFVREEARKLESD